MNAQKFIGYGRISVQKKRNGTRINKDEDYSIENQSRIYKDFIAKRDGVLIAEFSEIESGKNDKRPQVLTALELCKKENAILIVARFSRFMRSTSFLQTVRDSGVEFVACDFPTANKLMISILAAITEYQADEIGKQVKEALHIARERKGEWRKSQFNDEGRKKAAQTKSAKFLTNDMLRLGDYIKSLKKSGMGTTTIADEIKKSSFSNLIPEINKNKVESILRIQAR